jgi:hypothetical protein
MIYKVETFPVGYDEEDIYKVVSYTEGEDGGVDVFIGDLANCEAYIRLHKEGYM